jgi:hypothetical protein
MMRSTYPPGSSLPQMLRARRALLLARRFDFAAHVRIDAANDHFTAPGIAQRNQCLLCHLDSTWAERGSSPYANCIYARASIVIPASNPNACGGAAG